MNNFNDYISMIRGGAYRPISKIEWLREDETVESVLSEDIQSVSLSINRNNGVRRTCSIDLKSSSKFLPNIYGIWVRKKFKLYLGFDINGEEFWMPQGIFVITNPVYSSTPEGTTFNISGSDKFCLLNGEMGGILKDIYKIDMNESVKYAIRSLLVDFKDPKMPILDIADKTFPYTIVKAENENVGDLVKEISYFCASNVYYNEEGYLVLAEDIDDDKKGSEWDFNDEYDEFSFLSCDMESKFNEVRNIVKVIGDNVNNTVLVSATEINEDVSTGTEVSRIGEMVYVEKNDYISNNTEAINLAKYILKRKKVLASSATINSISIIHLDVDKVITVTNNQLNFDKKRLLIQQLNITHGLGGTMSISTVDTDEIDFTTGKVGEDVE